MKKENTSESPFPSKMSQRISEFWHSSAWLWTIGIIGAGLHVAAYIDYLVNIKP